jgi:hypothetical protein
MINLKKNLSFFLAILLIVLMYNTPNNLKDFSNQFLGKLLLVVTLSYIAFFCDLACAIIFAAIIIILLHDNREGYASGGLAQVINKTLENADKAEKSMGKQGFKETHGHDDDKDGFKGKKKKEKEGFIGLDKMKTVNEKLQKYLGFSITELDRQIKTSSEKNSQNATKDLQ